MVTPDVGQEEREILKIHWEIKDVDPIPCHHKYKSREQETSNYPDGLQQDMRRWKNTCTKFNAWKLTKYNRVIFMDSDTIVLNKIDDAFSYSNASLVAAPECFPPDTFNSGFMVLTPSIETYNYLISVGNEKGSAEGGDQGILNNYFCKNWFYVNDDDPKCGRLPWTYNVEAQYYETYKSYRKLYDMEPMKVIHYINDGKPWKTLMYDYNSDKIAMTEMIRSLAAPSYVASHMYWRYCFLRATGMPRPEKSIYYQKWDDVVSRKGIYQSLDEPFFDRPGQTTLKNIGNKNGAESENNGIVEDQNIKQQQIEKNRPSNNEVRKKKMKGKPSRRKQSIETPSSKHQRRRKLK